MPLNEDWSDSDEEELPDAETSVQLGLPDGPIEPSDVFDAAVSRIGGHPAFLTQEPALDCARCGNCSNQMELLVQLWCPLEESPNDRALYAWGCARSECQMKAGSVRVWRGLKLNEKYAAKLEARRARQKQKEEEKAKVLATEQARAATSKVNPFSLKASSNAPVNSFGLGAQIFGAAPASPDKAVNNTPDPAGSRSPQSDDEGESSDEDGELLTAMASTILEDSLWKSAPAYSPLYLSTAAEYLPPPPKSRTSPEEAILEEAAEGKNKDGGWKMEGYENSMDLDHVFERFTKRVGYLGEQCIRYELGGVPLPYAGDKIFDQLFPVPSSPYIAVTKGAFTAGNAKRTYSPASIPPCPICKSKRVFECQLMPNLINVLETGATNKTDDEPQTDEERRKEIELTLKKGLRGMQWGTCMIFSCEQDCCLDGASKTKLSWREEAVLVQWDT